MVSPKAIGLIFENDENGNIINPCSWNSIPQKWQKAIQQVVEFYQENYHNQLHSIYLRGSVALGVPVDYISDLDMFALIHSDETIRWEKVKKASQLEQTIRTQFPFIKEVDACISSFHLDLFSHNPRLSMVLKTQSICVAGNSILPQLPNFQVDESIHLNLTWLEDDITNYKQLQSPTNEENQVLLKVIIRSGYELVALKEKRYTNSLYFCIELFIKYYPAQRENAENALLYYLNPEINQQEIPTLVDRFGKWILNQIQK